MKNQGIACRNKVTCFLYQNLLKPIFFRRDPEEIHNKITKVGSLLGRSSVGRFLTGIFLDYRDASLCQHILGIGFENPVGLSAGFDKNAELTEIMPSVGFGFVEVGSVTGERCGGNPKPRLWRLRQSESLLVHYGLKNDGCEAISRRISGKRRKIPTGVSIAATNCPENADIRKAILDFEKAFRVLENSASYIAVNISCPNTVTGQPFLDPKNFDSLFGNLDRVRTDKPIFIKLSPDLGEGELDAILEIAKRHRIHGIICANLTKKRDNPKIYEADIPARGGFSGKPVRDLSDRMISYIRRKEGERFVLIGSGGVFTAEDAYRKIRLGASLVELITGMIFKGPQLISEINRGLAELIKKDGFANIGEAVGADAKI